ncbi:MAG: Hsp70 family protein, partial [Candidatus Aminicenantes bacterium]
HALQGEREVASENKSLGYFNLVGIPMAPKGIPQIDVTFEIDANGIVKVSAREAKTGLVQSMKIQPSSGLSPEEIQQRIQEARQYEEKDRLKVKLNQAKLKLKEDLETVKFFHSSHSKQLAPKEKSEMKNLISRSEKALEGEDLDTIESMIMKVQMQRDKINKLLISEFEK